MQLEIGRTCDRGQDGFFSYLVEANKSYQYLIHEHRRRSAGVMNLLKRTVTFFIGAIVLSAPQWVMGQDPDYEAQVAALAALPSVAQALELVEERDARTMADLLELTEIAAPPFNEDQRGERFLEMLLDLGVDSAWTDAEGNVLALRRGTGSDEVLAVAGHLDTVFPEGTDVTVRQRGDTLFAPGIGDDTRGLTAVLALLRVLNEAELQTTANLLFIGTVGEEGTGDLRGMKHLFREGGPRIDTFISIDGTGHTGITHQGLGSHRYRVTLRGPGGHSWGAFGLPNPAHALGRAIDYFDLAADAITRFGPRTSYNVGMIGGGTSVNSIPFEAWMEVDMRSESPENLQAIDEVFQRSVRRAVEESNTQRRDGAELSLEMELIGDRPSGEISESTPFVQQAIAVSRHLGIEPSLGRGSTDSNIPISQGIPAITIGGGGQGSGAHSPGEWFINRDGTLGIQRALLILLAQAGTGVTS
jgi:acetylornithine deacetylase/succinyl-diaminopimelate desuccinylase-like protein